MVEVNFVDLVEHSQGLSLHELRGERTAVNYQYHFSKICENQKASSD